MNTTGKRIWLGVSYALLAIIAICCIYPAVWVILSSVRPGTAIYSPHLWPEQMTLDHYKGLFNDRSFPFARWYMNTLKIAVFSTIFGTLLTLLAAYALSRFRFKGRKSILSGLLVLGMFPGFMSLIAIYILLLQFDLLDTHLALILVYSAGAPVLGTFVVKGYFDTIPRSLEESARMDGASNLRVFTSIMLPLSKPILTYTAVMTFTGAWVDFIFARAVLRSQDQWTVAVGMWNMVSKFQNSNFTMFAAGSVLIAVPITILFMVMQRYFVEGLTAGASKG